MVDYHYHRELFEHEGIAVYALSTDPEDKARETAERTRFTFPILYGVDGPKLAAEWGAYYEARRNVLHATAFVLKPDRRIVHATYSTGPAGRLTASEALALINFYRRPPAGK